MSISNPNQVLLRRADALRFCQQRALVSGVVAISELHRVSSLLREADGDSKVNIRISFGVDQQKRNVLNGCLHAVVPLLCQRCLGGVDWPVECEFTLALVWSDEQASQLPRTLDPVLMDSDELDLYAVVEDELLLALPLAAYHEAGSCSAPAHKVEPADDAAVVKVHPFNALAGLNAKGKPLLKNDDN